jgi:hypothetical protein
MVAETSPIVDPSDVQRTNLDAWASFTTYLRYLQHLDRFLTDQYGIDSLMAARIYCQIQALPSVKRIQRRHLGICESKELQKALRTAWNREGQIRALLDRPRTSLAEELPGTGHIAYYALNAAAQAYFIASGVGIIRDHANVLRALGDCVVQRKLFVLPWSIACAGLPSLEGARWAGVPDSVHLGAIHNWSIPSASNVWNGLAKILLTTRDRDLQERKREWRKKHRVSRIPQGEILTIADAMPPTTLFRFLWRLRKRDDYGDIDMFLEGVAREEHSREFLCALSRIVQGTLASLETLIGGYIGESELRSVVEHMPATVTFASGARERLRSQSH